jgi:hypothetical protein
MNEKISAVEANSPTVIPMVTWTMPSPVVSQLITVLVGFRKLALRPPTTESPACSVRSEVRVSAVLISLRLVSSTHWKKHKDPWHHGRQSVAFGKVTVHTAQNPHHGGTHRADHISPIIDVHVAHLVRWQKVSDVSQEAHQSTHQPGDVRHTCKGAASDEDHDADPPASYALAVEAS